MKVKVWSIISNIMDYCQFAREVMFWNLYFCNSLNRKRPTVISTTIKEGNFISSTSVDFLFITVFLLMFKLFHVALKIVTALTHYFLLFFNLLTGRNYDFDFTHIMPHFVIFFCYSLVFCLCCFTLKSGSCASFPVYLCPHRRKFHRHLAFHYSTVILHLSFLPQNA